MALTTRPAMGRMHPPQDKPMGRVLGMVVTGLLNGTFGPRDEPGAGGRLLEPPTADLVEGLRGDEGPTPSPLIAIDGIEGAVGDLVEF